jgi:AAA15 family ATPase/GTPase
MNEKHLSYFKIENFKRFESFEMNDIGQFNLILGDNNVGKTSVLEALLFDLENANQFRDNLLTVLYEFRKVEKDIKQPLKLFINQQYITQEGFTITLITSGNTKTITVYVLGGYSKGSILSNPNIIENRISNNTVAIGVMEGYDLDLIKSISESVNIPVVALGGAGKLIHLEEGYQKGFANGLAAGSLFVYQGSKRGVLINYPTKSEINF